MTRERMIAIWKSERTYKITDHEALAPYLEYLTGQEVSQLSLKPSVFTFLFPLHGNTSLLVSISNG
jgi:hypothetical protein